MAETGRLRTGRRAGRAVAAASYRTYTEASHGYGFVAQRYPAVSLSVAEGNPARRLYESVGFEPVKEGSSWTRVRHAPSSSASAARTTPR